MRAESLFVLTPLLDALDLLSELTLLLLLSCLVLASCTLPTPRNDSTGALLRGQGRDGKITDNFDAMRDLSGRR